MYRPVALRLPGLQFGFLPLPVGEGWGEQLCLKSTADD